METHSTELVLGSIFTIGTVAGTFLMLGVVMLSRRRERQQGRQNPLTENLLRSPGQSVRDQIDDLRWDVALYLALGMLPIPFVFGFFLAGWAAKGQMPGSITITALAITAIGLLGWLAQKLWTTLRKLRYLRLGYDAELAVGQELNELLREKWRVFHDFAVKDRRFNIDHVLVGPGGVFAVETKGRAKPKRREGSAHWEVTYDGTALAFPEWLERKPMRQAEAAAAWLRDWLSSAVAESVKVQPVVVLPGWYVKRTGPGGVPVLASGQIASYFTKARPILEASMIERVAHQLEQRCRDVTPLAYRAEREQ